MSRAETVVERVLSQARGRAEMYLAIGRAVLTALSLTRFFAVGSLGHVGGAERALVAVAVSLAALAVSLVILVKTRRQRSSGVLLAASVASDAALAFVALLSNVLWPWAGYRGILRVPDASFVLIVTLSSGLRVSTRMAIFGAALNVVLTVALVGIDYLRNAAVIDYAMRDATLHVMHVAFSGLGAWFFAAHSRRLVLATARETVRAERASEGLIEMLEEHHHVRSALSAASINAEQVLRLLARDPLPDASPALQTARALEGNLREVRAMLSEAQQRADTARMTTIEPELVDLGPLLSLWTPLLARRFPTMRVTCQVKSSVKRVWVAGGAMALERVLLNLALNAMEGDGERGASELCVRVEHQQAYVALCCLDNGPGLGPDAPAWLIERGVSRKPHSSGLGLFFVNTVVRASGGVLTLKDRPAGGAEVCILLRGSGGEEVWGETIISSGR